MPVCQTRCYRLEPLQIHYLRFVLEGYEGLALMTTLDPVQGVVRLLVAPGCEADVGALMSSLAQEMHLRPCEEPGREREKGT